MNDWQPIDTAPKDGTRILIYDDGMHYIASWGRVRKRGPFRWLIADLFNEDNVSDAADNPTHWQPLTTPHNT